MTFYLDQPDLERIKTFIDGNVELALLNCCTLTDTAALFAFSLFVTEYIGQLERICVSGEARHEY